MHQTLIVAEILAVVAFLGAIVYGSRRGASNLYWKGLICLTAVIGGVLIVTPAVIKYRQGLGGFKLGVDLVGGTILVYEIDPDKKLKEGYKPEQLAASLKRRIDPNDLYNVTIRPVSDTRIEIILPTGGARQAEKAEENWKDVLAQAEAKYHDALGGEKPSASRGQIDRLAADIVAKSEKVQWEKLLKGLPEKFPKLKDNKDAKLDEIQPGKLEDLYTALEKHAGVKRDEAETYVKENYKPEKEGEVLAYLKSIYGADTQRRDVTGEEVEKIKAKIRQVGSLEFRVLANQVDDKAVFDAVKKYYNSPDKPDELKQELERRARLGQLPPLPEPEDKEHNTWPTTRDELGPASYTWVEMGRQERLAMGLNNDNENASQGTTWGQMALARQQNHVEVLGAGQILVYSRRCVNQKLPAGDAERKKYEYFVLTRDPEVDPDNPKERLAVTGQDLTSAREDVNPRGELAVAFGFNSRGARRFADLTTKNKPTGEFHRQLAIILDDQIESAPTVREPITGGTGQITGRYTKEDVDQLVGVLRSGALPATLKPLPVSENTIGPTLGQDTIDSGLRAVMLAFAAVLVFMCIYYRFAGFVASSALLVNLLLTVAFMVFVNATFTLPGLAGLVLMLGMAVDANVLIYERLREERDKGANLITALRNGYDRALPAIIDTHLTSIFTAIVLYVVGNDQLKGFGISLAAGLVISLFTSLLMTHTIFDLWVKLGWLKKLSMLRFFSRPNIDFMRIRYYWFTATIVLTIFGISVFLLRGPAGLNIDFVGGTAFGGQLREGQAKTSTQMRQLLSEDRQRALLAVQSVKQTDNEGRDFEITYAADGQKQRVVLANRADSASQKQVDRKAAQVDQKTKEIEEVSRELQSTTRQSSREKLEAQKKSLEDERTQLQNELAQLRTSLDPQIRAEHEQNVKERAETLPDWSVEQIFLSSEANEGGASRFFTIRTTEKEQDLVHVTINRLLRDENGAPLLKQVNLERFEIKGRHVTMHFSDFASPGFLKVLLTREFKPLGINEPAFDTHGEGEEKNGRYKQITADFGSPSFAGLTDAQLKKVLTATQKEFGDRPQPERLENFDAQLAADTQRTAMYAVIASWAAILLYLWFRFGSWTFGAAAVLCLIHDLLFTLGMIAFCHYLVTWVPGLAGILKLEDFKIDLPAVAALLTLVGYSVNDTIVVFDRIREVRGKNPLLTAQMINDSINQTLSRTILASVTTWLVVFVLYVAGGEGVHLFAFVMVVGVIVGTYSSIYIASPLLLIFGEGTPKRVPGGAPKAVPAAPATV